MTVATDAQRLLAELERFRHALLEIAVKIEEGERANAARFRALCDTAQEYAHRVVDTPGVAEEARVTRERLSKWLDGDRSPQGDT